MEMERKKLDSCKRGTSEKDKGCGGMNNVNA